MAQNKASERYDKINTKFYGFKFNLGTDQDIIQLLDQADNKQAIVKSALRLLLSCSPGKISEPLDYEQTAFNNMLCPACRKPIQIRFTLAAGTAIQNG